MSTRSSLLALALTFALAGCASPRPPQPPAMVKVDDPTVVACEADDEGLAPAPRASGVTYVRMTEWQAPPSAQRVEAEVTPRGAAAPQYIQFPALTKHQPIGETRVFYGRRAYYWPASPR